jgi:hypothetical protein
MGKLATKSFFTGGGQTACQNALTYVNSNMDDIHPSIRASVGNELRQAFHASADRVTLVVGDGNTYGSVDICQGTTTSTIYFDQQLQQVTARTSTGGSGHRRTRHIG